MKEIITLADTIGADNIQWSIDLPENVVEDTVDGKVTINSDILGPMFQVNNKSAKYSF